MRNLIDAVWPPGGHIKTMLDLGCGDLWFTPGLPGVTRHVGVDIWEPAMEKAIAKNVPGFVPYRMDAREFVRLQAEASYDAVLALDFIEHFPEDEAKFLIGQVERIAKHLAVIWTTSGYIAQGPYDNNGDPNPHQEHFYGPTVEDFAGWQVDVYPEWHQDRGGGIFAHKIIIPLPVNPLDPEEKPWE